MQELWRSEPEVGEPARQAASAPHGCGWRRRAPSAGGGSCRRGRARRAARHGAPITPMRPRGQRGATDRIAPLSPGNDAAPPLPVRPLTRRRCQLPGARHADPRASCRPGARTHACCQTEYAERWRAARGQGPGNLLETGWECAVAGLVPPTSAVPGARAQWPQQMTQNSHPDLPRRVTVPNGPGPPQNSWRDAARAVPSSGEMSCSKERTSPEVLWRQVGAKGSATDCRREQPPAGFERPARRCLRRHCGSCKSHLGPPSCPSFRANRSS